MEAVAALSVRRVALVTRYMAPLAQKVVDYIEHEGVSVVDFRALEVEDNNVVGCIPGDRSLTWRANSI